MAADPVARLRALGFRAADAAAIAEHFVDADRRGKPSHGVSRIDFLARLSGLDPTARPTLVSEAGGLQRWDGNGAVGYLTLAAICDAQLAEPPVGARLVVAERTFPTGMLGYWVRRLAEGGLLAVLTATSPRRLPHPDGGPALTGTNPVAIGIPSSDGRPVVCDVSMGKATHGDVLLGRASEDDLVPFGARRRTRPSRWPSASSCSSARSQARSTAPSSSSRVPGTTPRRRCGPSRAACACRATRRRTPGRPPGG
ncbi:MAG: Ldh family oxidoreductase [Thermoleophilia bacterium]